MLEAIQFRRSVRSYQEEQLGAEVLNDIIEAGRFAPSGGNNQTTHFLILQNKEALSLLKALVKNAFSKMEPIPGMYKSMRSAIESSKRDTYDFMYNAPTLVVVANKTGYPNSMADSAVALENMMIQATALGVGSCWINQLHWLDGNASVRSYLLRLGLHPWETVCGALSLGYAKNARLRASLPRTGNFVTYVK